MFYFRPLTRRASLPDQPLVHIPVQPVTKISLPHIVSDNTLLRAKMPTKHVASPWSMVSSKPCHSSFLVIHLRETCPGPPFGRPSHRRYTPISNPLTHLTLCPPIIPSLSPPARSLRPDLGCTAQATLSPLVATRLRSDLSHEFSLNDTFSARLPATDHLLYCLSFTPSSI